MGGWILIDSGRYLWGAAALPQVAVDREGGKELGRPALEGLEPRPAGDAQGLPELVRGGQVAVGWVGGWVGWEGWRL